MNKHTEIQIISYTTIGRNIRAARRQIKQTQQQIADKLNMSPLHYGRLERGERPASLEQLALIARTLETTLPQLLSGCIEGESFGSDHGEQAVTLGQSITQIADGCSPQTQELMLALCRTIAEHDKKTEIRF